MAVPAPIALPEVETRPRGQDGSLRLQILGPLRLWRDGVELDPAPRQRASLLALLLARVGRPVSTSELIDMIWGDDVPASAINVIHKYVGTLRRLLEPELPVRATGSYLRRRGNAYQLTAHATVLDLALFREQAELAAACLAQQRRDAAFDHYLRALALWRGSAGDALTQTTTAQATFAALDAEFFHACEAAAELAGALGQPERVLPALRMAASMEPMHETINAALIGALGTAGRPAEALALFQDVRSRLADELGIEPGPTLRAAHQRALEYPAGLVVVPAADRRGRVVGMGANTAVDLVGRSEELAVLSQALATAFAGGSALALVEGEPGVGKTRLLEEATAQAERRGALVVWGRCLEGDGTPAMWPWEQAMGTLVDSLPASMREQRLACELGRFLQLRDGIATNGVLLDGGSQFRLFEQIVALVGQGSRRQPLVLVIDDLQWADSTSLQLFSHLAGRLPPGVVILSAMRDSAPVPGAQLSGMLATVSRVPGHRRMRLGPLSLAEVAELIRRETGRDPATGTARGIYVRTAGNPFLVRELSRASADADTISEDAAIRTVVPSTVRDIVAARMAGLDDEVRDLLQIAALIGRDIGVMLLARAAGLDAETCLERLEPLEALGLVRPTRGDPFSAHFAHDLVRESVSETTPARRTTQLHLSIANALDQIHEQDESVTERLAYHLWAAGPLADPARTASALLGAGRRAAAKAAFEAADQHLQSAAHLARRSGLPELELSALSLAIMVASMPVGYPGAPGDLRERAEHLARGLGREAEAADFLFSRVIAAQTSVQPDRRRVARLMFEHSGASADPIVRAYGMQAWGLHHWDIGDVGEAYRYLELAHQATLHQLARREENPLRHDLQSALPMMRAAVTALHGDVGAARVLLDGAEAAAGDDRYIITICAHYATMVASMAGDTAWALRAVRRWLVADPEQDFYLRIYLRQSWCWARALTGDDPAGAAAEAEELMPTTLLDPPRWGVAFHYGLIAEMWLAAGIPSKAEAALNRAEQALDTYDQRYAEGLLLLLRAQIREVRGEPIAVVLAAARGAQARSTERGAHLFAERAARFLAHLGDQTPDQ